jgi:hypothetical protein
MDEHALSFGRHSLLGCPYHGLVVGNRLTLPNGQHIDNQWNTARIRGAYRLAVPGVPAITRTPEQAAADAATGFVWRTDLVLWLFANDPRQRMYGRRPIFTLGVYAAGMGNCWGVDMPFSAQANEAFTALTAPATVSAVGRIGADPDQRSVTVQLSGYGPGVFPPSTFYTYDCSASGSRMLLGDTLLYDPAHDMYTASPGRLALLHFSGTGTPESPLGLELEFVADRNSAADSISDGFVLFDGVYEWQPAISEEWIPPKVPQPDTCQWLLVRTTAYDLAYLPKNPDIPVPSNWIRYITGVREASLTDYVIGGWLDELGEPVLVTCDIEYRFEAQHRMNCARSATTDREQVFRYIEGPDGCALDSSWSDDQYNVDGEFDSVGSYGANTIETLVYTLKVGGVELDSFTLEYVFDESAVLYGSSVPPANGSASLVHTYTLKLNGAVVDQFASPSPAASDTPAFARNLLVQPRIDSGNRFGVDQVEQWLPGAAVSEHKLPEVTGSDGTAYGPSVAVQVAPHWWSNTMVCLATRQRPWQLSLGGGTRIYGDTAHPGGVVAGSITVTAPSNSSPPPPRFGARDSLSGAVIVGHAQRIQYV